MNEYHFQYEYHNLYMKGSQHILSDKGPLLLGCTFDNINSQYASILSDSDFFDRVYSGYSGNTS